MTSFEYANFKYTAETLTELIELVTFHIANFIININLAIALSIP